MSGKKIYIGDSVRPTGSGSSQSGTRSVQPNSVRPATTGTLGSTQPSGTGGSGHTSGGGSNSTGSGGSGGKK